MNSTIEDLDMLLAILADGLPHLFEAALLDFDDPTKIVNHASLDQF